MTFQIFVTMAEGEQQYAARGCIKNRTCAEPEYCTARTDNTEVRNISYCLSESHDVKNLFKSATTCFFLHLYITV